MYEKANPSHPDKLCDRIVGALVDLAYEKTDSPKIAVEVQLRHGVCHIIAETSVNLSNAEVENIINRIAGKVRTDYLEVEQDVLLSRNQDGKLRCGDNGIFRGMPVTEEQKKLVRIAHEIYTLYPSDGKYILD